MICSVVLSAALALSCVSSVAFCITVAPETG